MVRTTTHTTHALDPIWKKAVVHLEAAGDKTPWNEQMKRIEQMWEEQRKGQRPLPDIAAEFLPKMRDRRSRGTAVFIVHGSRRYLVTARHVLTDAEAAAVAPGMDLPDVFPDDAQRRQERIDNWIYPIIFRVPSLDEVKRWTGYTHPEFLMNLAAGVMWMHPYTFSEPYLDLAVISLDQHDGRFADDLVKVGYAPVTLADVDQKPSAEGAEIYSVGYPDATAVLGQLPLHPASANWASSAVSVPVHAFGRVAMLRDDLPYFLADISIYPGNSGGPVVEESKLVGIVSGQAAVENMRIPFAKVIKSSFIADLISKQEAKDQGRTGVFAATSSASA